MLSHRLKSRFAGIAARLVVRTAPNSDTTRLSVRHDARGSYFELKLPLLSRCGIEVLDSNPRHRRLLLRVAHGKRRVTMIVQSSPTYRVFRATKQNLAAFGFSTKVPPDITEAAA